MGLQNLQVCVQLLQANDSLVMGSLNASLQALDAAKGLLYLHSCNPPIIHRDLKSPNL